MAVHDKRYKHILISAVFAYDVALLLADEFDLGTVARPTLQAGPTSSVQESERERIADSAWTFDTDRQRTVRMIVKAQSALQRHLAVRLLRYVVDRLLELCEDRQRYDDVRSMDRREDPDRPLLRLAFDIERTGDPGETVPLAQAIRTLEDEDAYALMTRFLSDEMQQWVNLRDARGRDDGCPLKEVEREMETIQERFDRLMDERQIAGLTAGEIVGLLVSFRRALADSGPRRPHRRSRTARRPLRPGRHPGCRTAHGRDPGRRRSGTGVRRADLGAAAAHPGRGCGAGVAQVRHRSRTVTPTAGPLLPGTPALFDPR
ncbi:MAG: Rpn family recombination-promoting nuclease/putative transposase [Caldilineaceae bacterium]|nr:Rpn family recombination-promoting nuclease/putative transposase [Caldilineaceae bacterium]